MMNILHFSQSVKWSSWFICSLLLHGLIFLAFIWRFSEVQPAMSPAPAIMLQWAEIFAADPNDYRSLWYLRVQPQPDTETFGTKPDEQRLFGGAE